MNRSILKLAAVAAICTSGVFAANAQAGVIDFGGGTATSIQNYIEDGFTGSASGGNASRIQNWQSATLTGEREMLFNSYDGTIKFTSSSLFNLLSFDIENPGQNYAYAGQFTLKGSNGASAIFNGADIGTKALSSAFSNLTWFSLVSNSGQATVDNFVFASPSSVPEPFTGALLGLGLLGFAAARRRKQ
jgi:hypothetical protein